MFNVITFKPKILVSAAFVLLAVIIAGFFPVFAAQETDNQQAKKVVLLYTQAPGHHPNEMSCRLFKYCLENSANIKNIKCELYENWPQDTSVLDNAATIVIYSEGTYKKGIPHPVFTPQRMEYLDKLMKKGVGIVCIHYTLYAAREVQAPKLLDWIGAYFDFQGFGSMLKISRDPQVCTPVTSFHPISFGWKEFTLPKHELYHNFRFSDQNVSAPILMTPFAIPDSWPQYVKQYVVAWALERKDSGRGFGFGGGHFYSNWMDDDCRKMILNAIVWTAKIDVPKDGVISSVPKHLDTKVLGAAGGQD